MSLRRILTVSSTLFLLGFLGLLAYGLLSGGGTGLARAIADGKRPPTPTIDLAVLYPPRRDWKQRDRAILADSRVRTRELAGRPTLINIWASWCIPCRQEAPVLEQAAARHPDVRFVGINVRDANRDAIAFIHRFQQSYINLDDPDDEAWNAFQATGVPESFLIDGAGRIVYHENGPFTSASIAEAIARISKPPKR